MRTEIDTRTFEHKGRTFTARLYRTENGFSVIALLDDQQVSPAYRIDFETHADYFMQHKEKLTEHLFELAESDIQQGLYFHPPEK
jgi:hypothetical protein